MKARRAPRPDDQLLDDYVRELTAALEAARKNFDASALRPPLQKGPPPLAADPRVLAVIRRYFFAYDKLHRAPGEPIQKLPHDFVMERLSPRHDDLLEHLLQLGFLPIGTDEKGEWV